MPKTETWSLGPEMVTGQLVQQLLLQLPYMQVTQLTPTLHTLQLRCLEAS